MKDNKKPRIAIIGVKGLPATGGAARAWENIITILKDDFDFTVYAINSHTSNAGKYSGVTQIIFKDFSNMAFNTFQYYIKSMFHCLFLRNYNLVVVNHVSSSFIIPLLRMRYNVLARAGGLSHLDKKWSKFARMIFKSIMGIFVKFSSEVICVSQEQADFLKEKYSKEIFSIPNGVLIDEKSLLNKKDKGYILFSAARIVEHKGLHVLLQALKKLKYTGKLIITGSLEHNSKYKEFIRILASGLNIEFIDLIKDKIELYKIVKNARFFVFPSQSEAMSNMLLEVASLKTPIIASDINDNKAIFNDKEVLFFKVDDIFSLSNKIDYALSNKLLMNRNAENAFIKVREKFSINITSMEYKRIINYLLCK